MEIVMPTRNVVLTDSQAKFVEQRVANGHYQNASEVLREGLRIPTLMLQAGLGSDLVWLVKLGVLRVCA
jgi:hypothetical protein